MTYSSSEESDLEEWVKHEFHGGIPGPVSGAATPGADGYSSRDDHAALAAAVKAGKPLEGAMADMAKELRAASMEKASEVEVKVPQCAYDPTQGHYVYVVEGVVDSAKVPDEFRYWCVWGKTTSRRTIRGGRRTIKRVVR